MQAQQINEFKKVATIGYLVSGLGLGLWSSALLPRLNLLGVGAITASVALSPVRKRQTDKAIADAKTQLDIDHAARRQQIKDSEKELQTRSVDLDARQMDLDRQSEQLDRETQTRHAELDRQLELQEQERTIADRAADNEIRDRLHQLDVRFCIALETDHTLAIDMVFHSFPTDVFSVIATRSPSTISANEILLQQRYITIWLWR